MELTAHPRSVPSSRPRRAPGPGPFSTVAGNILHFHADPLTFLEGMKGRYGDLIAYRMGPVRFALLSHPEHIESVLMNTAGDFHRDMFMKDLSRLTGQGLLSSDGEHWRRQRKLAAPALRRKQIAAYGDAMVAAARRNVTAWSDGTRSIHPAMMQISLEIVVSTLLNTEIPDEVGRVGASLDIAMKHFQQESQSMWRFVPYWVPASHRRRFVAMRSDLYGLVDRFIRKRAADPTPGDDLLYMLMTATDEDGEPMSSEQLRDEVLTMFLAGHETTALALTYALYAIADEPEVRARLAAEVDDVLGDRPATAADFGRLVYTRAVVDEAMRLYPPAWIVGRESDDDVTIGGYRFPRKTQILMSPWVVQRDPRWFSDPLEFRPERWLGDKERPRFAYFPFGGGPHTCIGNHFALMSAALVLASLVQQIEVERADEEKLTFVPSVTLRPGKDVRLVVRRRTRAS